MTVLAIGPVQKTVGISTPITQSVSNQSVINKSFLGSGSISRTITGYSAITKTDSSADLTGGGVLGIDVLGDFLLGDPAVTSWIIWITKKSKVN